MDRTAILTEARRALETVTGRTAGLLCSLTDARVSIPGVHMDGERRGRPPELFIHPWTADGW